MRTSLELFEPVIQCLTLFLSSSLGVDVAVFDRQCHLIASTRSYAEHKGQAVHSPFIAEVINQGQIVVTQPGRMNLCLGCRFQEHCPSTAEILSCIRLEHSPLGVISLTSFSPEGKVKLINNSDRFFGILNTVSNLFSAILKQKTTNEEFMSKMLLATIDLTDDAFLYIDSDGNITHYTPAVRRIFKADSIHGKPLEELLPEDIFSELHSRQNFSNRSFKNRHVSYFVTSVPISIRNKFSGAVIRINTQTENKNALIKKCLYTLADIKGNSNVIRTLKTRIKNIAQSDSTVLITGESGTGKELFAQAIHSEGKRSNGPFVAVNCAGIPETLLESELFGYEEGAFTGARKGGKSGKFELANGGTLFLDEIGDMPLHLQAKFLRVLQERTVERIGSLSPLPLDVRIIAATNKNLEEEVKNKNFREDLYYRINVIPIEIPPLRFRIEDIEPLALFFLNKFAKILGKNISGFSSQTLELLKAYPWPGNVRELENTIEYAVNMETENFIEPHSLPEKLRIKNAEVKPSLKENMLSLEYNTVKLTLDKYGWNLEGKKRAAKELGISLRTLYRILKKSENKK
jgi:transcriptional regulator with PAS, ATPase and Fis domain